MKILFATSPIGLGHASRDVAVAEKLREKFEIVFLSGGGASKFISDHGFRILDLYGTHRFKVSASGEVKEIARWLIGYALFYRRCKSRAMKVLRDERPDVLVSDEDFASIVASRKSVIKSVLITDLLETKFARSRIAKLLEKRMNSSMMEIIDSADTVLLPMDGDDSENKRFVGPIVREITESREALRRNFGFDRKTIIVTVGGTDAGRFLIKKAMEAFHVIKNEEMEMVIVAGPMMKGRDLVADDGIRFHGYARDLHKMIFAADLVVGLSGRSTIDESIAYGTPGIFIPLENHYEQEENARRLGDGNFDDLAQAIVSKLDEERRPRKSDGVIRAAEIISQLAERNVD